MKKTIFGFVFCFFLIFAIPIVYAQSIPITKTANMEKAEFDGKWTFYNEWKPTSSDRIQTIDSAIYIRSGHQENFIYVLLDVVPDKTFDKNEDHAVVCIDAKSEQSAKPDDNDFCFMAKLGTDKVITLQGSEESGKFEVVENHIDLIGVGGISDENDRYSRFPHTSYEFKIPIELFERTDHYGFFVKVFDKTKSEAYTWPTEIKLETNSTDIAFPSTWGLIYSPDKSLPEYDVPMLVLIIGIFSIILLSIRTRKYNLLKIQS